MRPTLPSPSLPSPSLLPNLPPHPQSPSLGEPLRRLLRAMFPPRLLSESASPGFSGNLLAILEEMETSEAFFSPGGLYKLRDYPELSQIKFRDVIPISAMNSVGIDSVSEIFRELVA